jgi:nucleolar MIF4G domain-containing protein 1
VDRKARRKAEREQKKSARQAPRHKPQRNGHIGNPFSEDEEFSGDDDVFEEPEQVAPKKSSTKLAAEEVKPVEALKRKKEKEPKPEKKAKKAETARSPSPEAPRISKALADRLAEDDAEIAELERRLGMKSKKGLPQAFKDDGLDELLAGIDSLVEDTEPSEKRKRKAESDEWLEEKRKKARKLSAGGKAQESESEEESEGDDEEEDFSGEDFDEEDDSEDEGVSDDDEGSDEDGDSDFLGFDSEDEKEPAEKRVRENPYLPPVAPTTGTTEAAVPQGKYIPPSLRRAAAGEDESLSRLRRQTQGLVNRLTEANLISILGDIENLYRSNARQHVTSTLVDLLLISVCKPTTMPDTLIILPAGFIAAVYKVIGTDFGAQVIQSIVEQFDKHYADANAQMTAQNGAVANISKETTNLITLLSELYNFQVVGSNLMFDYIRLFLGTLSELNAELLLKVIRTSGPQLRQDDPSALKEIVNMLRPAAEKMGEANMSVRTKFMIETINDLKNNKMKTGVAASQVVSEHTVRMKKTLGSLNNRSLKATEAMRIGLKDIRDSDKKGKWWLVGAKWAGKEPDEEDNSHPQQISAAAKEAVQEGGTTDLLQLAREQRMNTDIRRAIFITIMSATDFQDAYAKLMKLKLKKVQELEIPKVLTHCTSSEAQYNPYYTLIAKKLCGDRKLKMAFQFTLWDFFKRMGENNGEDDDVDDDEESLTMRHVVNLAKMYGSLIADGGLTLTVLKNLNLTYLQPKTKVFLEVLFITMFLEAQKKGDGEQDETPVVNLILRVKDAPLMATGLQYFIKKVIRKTDIAGGKKEKATVKWASQVALDALQGLLMADS